jgi:hypothetical protein
MEPPNLKMKRGDRLKRFHQSILIASTIVFGLSLAMCSMAGSIDPRQHFVTLAPNCYISIGAWPGGPRVEVFNNSAYGPYQGSIIDISGPIRQTGPKKRSSVTITGFGDFYGIYYRIARWLNGASLWTLSVSLIYFLVASAILPLAWLVRWWKRRSPQIRPGFPVEPQQSLKKL